MTRRSIRLHWQGDGMRGTRLWVRGDGRRLPTPALLAVVLFAAILVLATLGLKVIVHGSPRSHWNLDSDLGDAGWAFPAFFSAGLLCAAGCCAVAAGRGLPAGERRRWYGLGAFLFFMGLDEGLAIHERIESLAGVDWQLLYVPIVAAGAIAWLLVTLSMRGMRGAQLFMVLGAGAWLVAQFLEMAQWSGDTKLAHYDEMMFAEEVLEMAGGALFLVAVYTVLLASRRAQALLQATPSRLPLRRYPSAPTRNRP